MFDGAAFGKEMTDIVRGYVERATAPLISRIDELEKRQPERGADGAAGRDGAPGDRGEKGLDGTNGTDGAAGRGVAKLLIDAKGHLIVTFSDGSTDDVGLIVGKNGQDGKDGRDGADGKSGDKGMDGKDGLDGARGADGSNGVDGAAGRDGTNGQDGKSVDVETVAQLVHDEIVKAWPGVGDMVQRAVDTLPRPRDGQDGKDGTPGATGEKGDPGHAGKDGLSGRDGVDGEKGADGKDGVGLADAVIDRDGKLVLTMTDGRHKALGTVLGNDGKQGPQGERGEAGAAGIKGEPGERGAAGEAGQPGTDGLGFDDLALDYDGERTVTLRFHKGDRIKEYPIEFPIVLDKGVWQERGVEGAGYRKGDGVTWGGQFYIARKETFAKPDDHEAWRLSVKRGRDAKEPVSLK